MSKLLGFNQQLVLSLCYIRPKFRVS